MTIVGGEERAMLAREVLADVVARSSEWTAAHIRSGRDDNGTPLVPIDDALSAMLTFGAEASGIGVLREALEPFAKMGGMLDGPFAPALFRDDQPIGLGGAWSENGEPRTITFGDLRRAATAYALAASISSREAE